jgi:bifunctional DNA-binding transcriptional regulator/antitoxin component of YhaV-PrlF toxin-antitoxin module
VDPKHIAEKLGLVEGSTVAFKKDRDAVIMKRVENHKSDSRARGNSGTGDELNSRILLLPLSGTQRLTIEYRKP